jgi:phosphoribosylanthranilate isomerase
MIAVKFCGLTRAEDVAAAESLGAGYVGAVFAGGPRLQSAESARALFQGVTSAQRAGVIGAVSPEAVVALARTVQLDVVQLHGDPTPEDVHAVREALRREGVGAAIWAVARVAGADVPPILRELFLTADAVVLDTRSVTGMGGTGASFDWAGVAERIAPWRGATPLVVAGGLRPETVAEAIELLRPAVVDVSSGVESAPGIKDRLLMRRFADAARAAWTDTNG